jgi:two-component system sensor histidine kinase/response regulator
VTQSIDTRAAAGIRLLVAEDDLVTRMVLKKLLDSVGYQADFVEDGQQAVDVLRQQQYDLVLMDCFMPRLDGFAATRQIRGATDGSLNPRIPIIAMTGLTADTDRERCLDAGMDDHIGKPVKADELVATVEKNLGRAAEAAKETGSPWEGDFLDILLEKFTAEIPQVVESLNLAVEGSDLAGLERIGHRLRGASDILEIRGLSTRSHALEQAGKAGDSELAGQLACELVNELQKMADVLKC